MKTLSKQLMSLFLALTMVFSLSATAFAAETSSVSNISDHEINVTMDDILSLKPFVIREANGTLSIDVEAANKNDANLVAIEALTQHFAVINPEILKGTLSVDENLNVIYNKHPIKVPVLRNILRVKV